MIGTVGGNLYEILEIPTDADEKEVKRAYHRLARDLHPDKATSPDENKVYEERFAQVSAAYNVLKDPTKRAEYDKTIKRTPGQGGPAPAKSSPTQAVLSAARVTPTPARPGPQQQFQGNPGLTPERISIANKAYVRGMQFYKEANFLKAIEFFEAAIKNNDTEANYHSRLAIALIKSRKSATRAIEEALRASDLDPYNLEHKFNLAFVYETIGSKSNAQKAYEDILRWDKDNARANAGLAALNGKKRGAFSLGGGKNGFLQQIVDKFKR